jgi:beta-lactamase superfamily II metal-dependent hydrolase
MMKGGCDVLRAVHHGSGDGTQWERLKRLDPKLTVVSSESTGQHSLSDVVGASVFAKFVSNVHSTAVAALTEHAGTIQVVLDAPESATIQRFGDTPEQNVNLANAIPLTKAANPTDWRAVPTTRVAAL